VSAARLEPANIAFEDSIVLISDRAPSRSFRALAGGTRRRHATDHLR